MGFDLADYYYWFYSTLTQSLAAFLGIIGVFAVFRLQIQHAFIEDSFSKLRNFMLKNDPRGNDLKISSMDSRGLLRHCGDLNNFWANRCIEYGKQIRGWQKEDETAIIKGIDSIRIVINQNISRNNDIISLDRKSMAELQLLNTKCIHGNTEKGIISGKGFYIIKHLCMAVALSIFGLYFVKELVFLPKLSNFSRFVALALILYVFFIGIKVLKFFELCLRGDFLADAFKDAENKKG